MRVPPLSPPHIAIDRAFARPAGSCGLRNFDKEHHGKFLALASEMI
jgi:hypothetical protein